MSTPPLINAAPPERETPPVYAYSRHDDEIDLIGLLNIFIRRKFTILLFVCVALLAGLAASYFLSPRWTSRAILIPPEAAEMHGMKKVLTGLAVLDIETKITPDTLLSDFMRNFDSRSIREKYLINTAYFKHLTQSKKLTPLQRNQLINGILEGNITSRSSEQDKSKKEYRYFEVAYSAKNGTIARDLLAGYIRFVIGVVQQELYQNLSWQLDMLRGKTQGQYQMDLKRAKSSQRIKIERLQYSLDIARAAGLFKPTLSQNGPVRINEAEPEDEDYSILLGVKGLERKLQIEQAMSDVARMNSKLQEQRLYIDQLNAMKIGEIDVQPFKFMTAPYQPVAKDSPRQMLILTISALMGLVIGSGYVLLNDRMRERAQA
ncbi:LPS O-antigen length regulator Wzz(fepE) [Pseudomonas graminis]